MDRRIATRPETLRLFDAVVTHGTEAAAARALGIGQPQVSRVLARMQQELGLRLLERSGRRLVVTEEGLLLQAEARRVLAVLDDLPATLGGIAQRKPRRGFRILAQPHLGHGLLPRAAAQLARSRPELRLLLDIRMRNTLEDWREARPHDLAVLVAGAEPPDGAITLFEHPLLVALPAAHRLARGRAAVEPAALAGEPFIALRPGQVARAHLDWLHATAGRLPWIVAETTAALSALQLVAEGLGLAMTDPLTARLLAHDKRWRARPVAGAAPIRVCAVPGPGRPAPADLAAVLAALRTAA